MLDLDVPRELVLARLSARRVCRDCGTNYVASGYEKLPWICEVCGGDVMHRDDDTPEAIEHRLDLYEQQTAPLIEYYQSQGRLAVIDGVGSPEHVFRLLAAAVDATRAEVPMRRLPRRSADELRHMRAAGRVVAEMHEAIRAAARPGVTTLRARPSRPRRARPPAARRRTSSDTTAFRR